MDALFVIPTMVSDNVNFRLVPALCKLIERNTLLSSASSLRTAALKKYSGLFKSVTSESTSLNEANAFFNAVKQTGMELATKVQDQAMSSRYGLVPQQAGGKTHVTTAVDERKNAMDFAFNYSKLKEPQQRELITFLGKDNVDAIKNSLQKAKQEPEPSDPYEKLKYNAIQHTLDVLRTGAGSEDRFPDRKTVTTLDTVELPHDITFFHNISLEPTYINIPITVRGGNILLSPLSYVAPNVAMPTHYPRLVRVGMKAIPYAIKNVNSILDLMDTMGSQSKMNAIFYRKWNQIKNNLLIGSKRWNASRNVGDKTGTEMDIIFAPSSQLLANSSFLKGYMDSRDSKNWSTMVILSIFDFGDREIKDSLKLYRRLVDSGWGDILIVNEPKESIYFCTTKIGACYELSLSYLKQILNLTNVIDYSEIRSFKPFRVSSIGGALREGFNEIEYDDIQSEIKKIIS